MLSLRKSAISLKKGEGIIKHAFLKSNIVSLIFLSFILVCAGCATPNSINKHAKNISYDNGISAKESIYIAQKHCLDNEISDVFLSFPQVTMVTSTGEWQVRFQERYSGSGYLVFIDSSTGEVTSAGYEN